MSKEHRKIELKEVKPITQGEYGLNLLNKVKDLEKSMLANIQRHNHLIALREEIACCADEYMKINFQNLSKGQTRHLLIMGCDAEMDNLRREIGSTETSIERSFGK